MGAGHPQFSSRRIVDRLLGQFSMTARSLSRCKGSQNERLKNFSTNFEDLAIPAGRF